MILYRNGGPYALDTSVQIWYSVRKGSVWQESLSEKVSRVGGDEGFC